MLITTGQCDMCHRRCSNKTLCCLEKSYVICRQKDQRHRGFLIWAMSQRTGLGRHSMQREHWEPKSRGKSAQGPFEESSLCLERSLCGGWNSENDSQWPSPFYNPLPLEDEWDLSIWWDIASMIIMLDSKRDFSIDFESIKRKIIRVDLT